MNSEIADLKQQFAQVFGEGGKIHIIRAPGRVNLIGEHTDYNDGFVFPMAIEPHVLIACRSRDDSVVRLASTVFSGKVAEFNVDQPIKPGDPKWANYSKGVAAELMAAGIPLPGMDAVIANTLPVGGGLSSSAAIEVATAQAFLTLAGLKMDANRLALICQRAEHEYAGVPVGIMDQMIVASAKAGQAILLDCRDLSKQFVPIDPKDLTVVIANSMVKHELVSGEYAERRKQCEEGVAILRKENPGIKALRDVSLTQLDASKSKLPELIYRRCRHVVVENRRTTEAAALLRQNRYEQVGQLMVQSHESLRDDYEVSVPELDFLVEEAMKVKGVYGARMTGGGFGGCIVAIAQPRSADALIAHLASVYPQKFNKIPTVFATPAAAGVSVLE